MNDDKVIVGIDIGGTFTDLVFFDTAKNSFRTLKFLSTPEDPSKAVFNGLKLICDKIPSRIIHGSTVATNALLERKGAKTALITTKGFRDVLAIGRQNRSNIYNLTRVSNQDTDHYSSDKAHRPEPLVKSDLRYEINERVNYKGKVLVPINIEELDFIIDKLRNQNIESVAVSFLFSFLNSDHEQRIADILNQKGFFTSTSSTILPEFREYERTSTTVVNAYVSPIMKNYINNLVTKLDKVDFRIMQSNGGCIQADRACEEAVRTILSGPAGGVVGAFHCAKRAGFDKVITFDMGGTSTDVSLCNGEINVTSEGEIGGLPIRIPVIDIHTVGSGGGSIARVDLGGALRVGPESAGANPGPACYDLGGKFATVTDANLLLGRIPHDNFLGGSMKLNPEQSKIAISELFSGLNINVINNDLEPYQTASSGIIQVVNTHMERALRIISVEKGHDPRDFTLVSFGGAGGLHACDLARALGIRQVMIPKGASTLSAFGMLTADVVKDYVKTVMLPGETEFETINKVFEPIINQGLNDVLAEGIDSKNISLKPELDIRYKGQSFELKIPFTKEFAKLFHDNHEQYFGYKDDVNSLEIVNLRLTVKGTTSKPDAKKKINRGKDITPHFLFNKTVCLSKAKKKIPFYNGEELIPGNLFKGPCIILYKDTTVFLDENNNGHVDEYCNLLINIES